MTVNRSTVPLRVCVFGGARGGCRPQDRNLARSMGERIGSRGHELIYGAGGVGIMGATAWAVAEEGGAITGVIPEFLRLREVSQVAPGQELLVTDDLFDRKRVMLDRADAFVALPGGYGTLDEILEVISLQALGQTAKPLVLLAGDGLWNHLVDLLDTLVLRGFADQVLGVSVHLASTAEEALHLIEGAGPVERELAAVTSAPEVVRT